MSTFSEPPTKRRKSSMEAKHKEKDTVAMEMYRKMKTHIATPTQLNLNGYPRPGANANEATFKNSSPPGPFNAKPDKVCSRCRKQYVLDVSKENCTYHPRRPFGIRYQCCQKLVDSEGCRSATNHVHDENTRDLSGYITTTKKEDVEFPGIFSIDCEMSYTVHGRELTSVSIMDHNCKPVYESFVKPKGRIIDYNTEYSGITEKDLRDVTTTLDDVHAFMLEKFSSDTILVGHSLESDLVALRLIHETIADTALVYPHRRGWPYKRALRTLASDYLGMTIQMGKHDSSEDSSAAMKLMLRKVRLGV